MIQWNYQLPKQNWLVLWATYTYNHGQKSWDTFAFLGRFPIHTGPTPPLTPQTMLDEVRVMGSWRGVSINFSEFQLCIGWGEAEVQESFERDALF